MHLAVFQSKKASFKKKDWLESSRTVASKKTSAITTRSCDRSASTLFEVQSAPLNYLHGVGYNSLSETALNQALCHASLYQKAKAFVEYLCIRTSARIWNLRQLCCLVPTRSISRTDCRRVDSLANGLIGETLWGALSPSEPNTLLTAALCSIEGDRPSETKE